MCTAVCVTRVRVLPCLCSVMVLAVFDYVLCDLGRFLNSDPLECVVAGSIYNAD